MLGTILLVVLVLVLIAAIPGRPGPINIPLHFPGNWRSIFT